MDVIKDILWILLLSGGIGLIIVIVIVLLRLKSSVESLLQEIKLFSQRMEPVIEKLEAVAEKTEAALSMIMENRDNLSEATNYIRRVAANIYRLENTFQEQIEPSVNALARRLMAFRRGVDTFLEMLKRR